MLSAKIDVQRDADGAADVDMLSSSGPWYSLDSRLRSQGFWGRSTFYRSGSHYFCQLFKGKIV
eukprot:4767855-Prymnesium_polylepis.1